MPNSGHNGNHISGDNLDGYNFEDDCEDFLEDSPFDTLLDNLKCVHEAETEIANIWCRKSFEREENRQHAQSEDGLGLYRSLTCDIKRPGNPIIKDSLFKQQLS